MVLNCFDLCVSITTVVLQIMRLSDNKTPIWTNIRNVTESLYMIFVEGTGFITFLLSVTRCLSVSLPWHNIKGLYVAILSILFVGYTMIREIAFWIILLADNKSYHPTVHAAFILGGIGMMIISVLIVNLISIRNILRDRNITENSRETSFQATVTVAILSAIFCLLNTFYFVSMVLHFYFVYSGTKLDYNFAFNFGIFYAVPINSALNPLVYIFRKQEMREYIFNLVLRIIHCQYPLNQDLSRVNTFSTLNLGRLTPTLNSMRPTPILNSMRLTPTLNSMRPTPILNSMRLTPTLNSMRLTPTLNSMRPTPILNSMRTTLTLKSISLTPTLNLMRPTRT